MLLRRRRSPVDVDLAVAHTFLISHIVRRAFVLLAFATARAHFLFAHTLVLRPVGLLAGTTAVVHGVAPAAFPMRSVLCGFLSARGAQLSPYILFESLHGLSSMHDPVMRNVSILQ